MPGISAPRRLGVRMALAAVLALQDMPGWREKSVSSATPKANMQMACCWAVQGGILQEKGSELSECHLMWSKRVMIFL